MTVRIQFTAHTPEDVAAMHAFARWVRVARPEGANLAGEWNAPSTRSRGLHLEIEYDAFCEAVLRFEGWDPRDPCDAPNGRVHPIGPARS